MSDEQPPIVARATAAPGSWVRLPFVECRHVAMSSALIELAARRVPSGGRAIVLGPGACHELPLRTLADRCASVALVDRMPEIVEQAIAPLRSQTTCQIAVRSEDLIGVNDEFLAGIDACLAEATSADEAARRMVELAQVTEPRLYQDSAGPYDLVIASCVLSQLTNALMQGAVSRITHRFPFEAPALAAAPSWTEALFALSERSEAAFMQSLMGLLGPGGSLYLSETIRACFVQLDPHGGWRTAGMFRMTRRPRLADYFEGRFIVDRQESWPWLAQTPSAEHAGRLFQVEGAVLRA